MKKDAISCDRILEAVCSVLQEQRKAQGVTQLDLADRAGMQRSYISDVEQGARNLSVKNLYRISMALDLQMSELVERAVNKVTSSRKRR